MSIDDGSTVSEKLIDWYEHNKRDLPWRHTDNPYLIWISEIILQQTRVNQGMDYYLRFVDRFPDVQTLAAADENEVLKYWQGLGYYSRARNLHRAARQIMEIYSGQFPISHSEVLCLSGIGDYTAAAICSFAYDHSYAVVDGNVYRVLSRYFGIETPIDSTEGKKLFSQLAKEILSPSHPGIHNQAVMEFGALQCVPANPDCEGCVLRDSCVAFESNRVSLLPIKDKKTKVTKRHFNYLYIRYGDSTFLQKRTKKDVWQNLYEFPLIESDHLFEVDELLNNPAFNALIEGVQVNLRSVSPIRKHILTHRQIFARVFVIEIDRMNEKLNNFELTNTDKIHDYPVSRLMEMFLEDHLA